MILEYNNIFWSDSILKNISVEYDNITINIFNDSMQKSIEISCLHCIGISDFIVWDEVIVEDVFINSVDASKNTFWQKAYRLHGNTGDTLEKSLSNPFHELTILLVNGVEIKIICQKIVFTTE